MAKPDSLEALFKNKAKKKPKGANLNAEVPKVEAPKFIPASSKPPAEGPDEGWERALKKDQELLKSVGLVIKEVEADGACLFRAFADQLSGEGGTDHAAYREKCVDFMRDHREDFEPFLEEDFNAYCKRMRKSTTWGGQVEAQALAKCHGVNALIHRPAEAGGEAAGLERCAVEIIGADPGSQCVQLSYHPTHHAGQHYNSVRFVEDDGSGPVQVASLAELQRRREDAVKPKEPEPVKEEEEAEPEKPKSRFSASVF